MKYLKTYGDIDLKYEIGDYVLISLPKNDNIHNSVKIYKNYAIITDKDYNSRIPYLIKFFDKIRNKELQAWIYDYYIDRLLTSEEIEEFEFIKDTKKYNL